MSKADNEAKKRLRKLAREQGWPNMVCIEKEQLNRLKLLATSYLQLVVREGHDKTGEPTTDNVLKISAENAAREIKSIQRL